MGDDVEATSSHSENSSRGQQGNSMTSSDSGGDLLVLARRKPIPRKGHTKSRKGCFPCKRRKVKCPEDRPSCGQCEKLGLVCEYPAITRLLPPSVGDARHQLQQRPSAPVSVTPGAVFSLEDLRFFHHFMLDAQPPIPVGAADVWRRTAGSAYGFDYLAHAVLGYAATHLTQNGVGDYACQAMNHRCAAIKLVNERMDAPCGTIEEGDALFGAIMILTNQAAMMDDAMVEFMTLVRGCNLVATSMMPDFDKSAFGFFTSEGHVNKMLELSEEYGDHTRSVRRVDELLQSVESLGPLCKSTVEVEYLALLRRVVRTARDHSLKAWIEYIHLYMMPSHMPPREYAAFVDPANYTARVLLAHNFLLDYVLGEHIFRNEHSYGKIARKRVILSWISSVAEKLPSDYRSYMTWPLSYAHELLGTNGPPPNVSVPKTIDSLFPPASSTLNFDCEVPMTGLEDGR